jgi:hypothetical protein
LTRKINWSRRLLWPEKITGYAMYRDEKLNPLCRTKFITGQNEREETTQDAIVTKSAAFASYVPIRLRLRLKIDRRVFATVRGLRHN